MLHAGERFHGVHFPDGPVFVSTNSSSTTWARFREPLGHYFLLAAGRGLSALDQTITALGYVPQHWIGRARDDPHAPAAR